METVEGVVRFRNHMGNTIHIKVEAADKQVHALSFRREPLGDARFTVIKGVQLGDTVRASGTPGTDRHLRPLLTVEDFVLRCSAVESPNT